MHGTAMLRGVEGVRRWKRHWRCIGERAMRSGICVDMAALWREVSACEMGQKLDSRDVQMSEALARALSPNARHRGLAVVE